MNQSLPTRHFREHTDLSMANCAFVHEGPEGGAPELRALLDGIGNFMGATGKVLEEPVGVNRTGLFNIHHTFRIETNSLS